MDMNEAGIEGKMFNFIQNFLKPRSYRVKVNETLCGTKARTEDIPQGSVVSPTFFILKIKKNVSDMPNYNRFQILLCMGDLHMSYCYPNWRVVEKKLQEKYEYCRKVHPEDLLQFLCKQNI